MTTQTLRMGQLIVLGPVANAQQANGMPENAVTKVTVGIPGKAHTQEGLDYMAAVRTAAACDLPGAFLVELAAKCPPPPEWLDTEEEMPF
jgi:hypothetical protein